MRKLMTPGTEMVEFPGRCPFCNGALNRSGENLVCENGDYIVNKEKYDKLWEQFKQTGNPDESDADTLTSLIAELLRDLKDANLKE
jgi:hypothetical protein